MELHFLASNFIPKNYFPRVPIIIFFYDKMTENTCLISDNPKISKDFEDTIKEVTDALFVNMGVSACANYETWSKLFGKFDVGLKIFEDYQKSTAKIIFVLSLVANCIKRCLGPNLAVETNID